MIVVSVQKDRIRAMYPGRAETYMFGIDQQPVEPPIDSFLPAFLLVADKRPGI